MHVQLSSNSFVFHFSCICFFMVNQIMIPFTPGIKNKDQTGSLYLVKYMECTTIIRFFIWKYILIYLLYLNHISMKLVKQISKLKLKCQTASQVKNNKKDTERKMRHHHHPIPRARDVPQLHILFISL